MAKPARGRGSYDRTQTTDERRTTRVEHVLDIATAVFAARGYAGTRADDIVAAAGISKRTLYEDFESVAAIIEAIYERAVRTSFAIVIERLAPIRDPIEQIHAGVAAYLEGIAHNPAAARVVFEEYRLAGPAQAARYELNTMRYVTMLLQSLVGAHAAGRLARAPDEASVYALTKGIEAVAMRAIHRGEHAQLAAHASRLGELVIDAFGGAT